MIPFFHIAGPSLSFSCSLQVFMLSPSELQPKVQSNSRPECCMLASVIQGLYLLTPMLMAFRSLHFGTTLGQEVGTQPLYFTSVVSRNSDLSPTYRWLRWCSGFPSNACVPRVPQWVRDIELGYHTMSQTRLWLIVYNIKKILFVEYFAILDHCFSSDEK